MLPGLARPNHFRIYGLLFFQVKKVSHLFVRFDDEILSSYTLGKIDVAFIGNGVHLNLTKVNGSFQ